MATADMVWEEGNDNNNLASADSIIPQVEETNELSCVPFSVSGDDDFHASHDDTNDAGDDDDDGGEYDPEFVGRSLLLPVSVASRTSTTPDTSTNMAATAASTARSKKVSGGFLMASSDDEDDEEDGERDGGDDGDDGEEDEEGEEGEDGEDGEEGEVREEGGDDNQEQEERDQERQVPIRSTEMHGAQSPGQFLTATGRKRSFSGDLKSPSTPRDDNTDRLALPPVDVVAVLEARIAEDPRGDMDAWVRLIAERRSRHKAEDIRDVYSRFVKVFPQSVGNKPLRRGIRGPGYDDM